jgi:hypothetical protein
MLTIENRGKLWLGFDCGSLRSVYGFGIMCSRNQQDRRKGGVALTSFTLTLGIGWLISFVVPKVGGLT